MRWQVFHVQYEIVRVSSSSGDTLQALYRLADEFQAFFKHGLTPCVVRRAKEFLEPLLHAERHRCGGVSPVVRLVFCAKASQHLNWTVSPKLRTRKQVFGGKLLRDTPLADSSASVVRNAFCRGCLKGLSAEPIGEPRAGQLRQLFPHKSQEVWEPESNCLAVGRKCTINAACIALRNILKVDIVSGPQLPLSGHPTRANCPIHNIFPAFSPGLARRIPVHRCVVREGRRG